MSLVPWYRSYVGVVAVGQGTIATSIDLEGQDNIRTRHEGFTGQDDRYDSKRDRPDRLNLWQPGKQANYANP